MIVVVVVSSTTSYTTSMGTIPWAGPEICNLNSYTYTVYCVNVMHVCIVHIFNIHGPWHIVLNSYDEYTVPFTRNHWTASHIAKASTGDLLTLVAGLWDRIVKQSCGWLWSCHFLYKSQGTKALQLISRGGTWQQNMHNNWLGRFRLNLALNPPRCLANRRSS